jgi:hypothetical protein
MYAIGIINTLIVLFEKAYKCIIHILNMHVNLYITKCFLKLYTTKMKLNFNKSTIIHTHTYRFDLKFL